MPENDVIRRFMEKSNATKAAMEEAKATFSKEEQEKFAEQLCQYSQDTGRDGKNRMDAAEGRGLVFVEGIPVPKEVAKRMEELKREEN